MTVSLSTLGQIALPVSDTDRAEDYYGKVLGLTRLFRFGHLVFFDCGGVRLMLEGNSKEAGHTDGVCLYSRVAAIEGVYQELRAHGASFDDAPHLIAKMPDHELCMAFFRDPDRNLLAIMEEKR
jgi:catechol 2,3-dioxygenase-like lactoylglutathione lyase family enzyme